MRIIGTIPHQQVRITVFQLSMKFAIKIEAGLLEQTYKIRESDHIRQLRDIENLVDEAFIQNAIEQLKTMNTSLSEAFKRKIEK